MSADVAAKRVVVMGLGRFGGGIGATRWLCAHGAHVHVTDLATEEDLAESLRALNGLSVTRRLGGHDEADLDRCDLLVVSPAVDKGRSEFFLSARRRNIPWTSEMNLFLERCPARIVGVTGSVGKSTTTAMIAAILDAGRREKEWRHGGVWLGGNIGRSLLDDLPKMSPRDLVVLELSSFQLEDAAVLARSPNVAVLTNLKENHLDRHGDLDAYAAAKSGVYRHQKEDDWLIMPRGGGEQRMPGDWQRRKRLARFSVDPRTRRLRLEFPADGGPADLETAVAISVPGLHNVQNAAAALAVGQILGVPDAAATSALSAFEGLPHRLEFVREYRGVKYYNDSKATTPEAAMTSLRAFDGGVVMLVGGSDKGSSFDEMCRLLAERAKAVICL